MKRPHCSVCRKAQSPDYRPFCSKHCADVDLQRWLVGRYAIPAAPDDTDDDAPPDSHRSGVDH